MSRKVTLLVVLGVVILGLTGWGAWYAWQNRTQPIPSLPAHGDAESDPLARRFSTQVRPLLDRYCTSCHGPDRQEAALDISRLAADLRHWEHVAERLRAGEMPPDDAPRHPTSDERAVIVTWITDVRDREANRSAGDPGPVLARRLSNAEYDYTIRDLTGIDIRPTKEFPVDPANEAGFDNTGESLTMSPALARKYLAAARLVADHVGLKPHGFVFAPHPVVTETDRDKYCVRRIIDFYQRHQVDLADYFHAAWRFQHREGLGKPNATLNDFADEARLSARYLNQVWSLLADGREAVGPLGEVRAAWRNLPGDAGKQDEARRECESLRDLVTRLRKELAPKGDRLQVKGISQGSQPFVLWRNDQLAARHTSPPDNAGPDTVHFCRVFPDAFVVTERAPYYDASSSPKGRLLSSGFHLMHGYYRDDGPLCELVLDEEERRELDVLWRELNFVTLSPMRQYKDFIFFERAEPPRFMFEAEFDFARSEDKDVTSQAKMERLAAAYLARAEKKGATGDALKAIETYFAKMSAEIRRVERARLDAEPSHLAALMKFAERAYRRPLTAAERDDLLGFYHQLRRRDELGHEEALRDTVVAVLMSPHFCFRFDLVEPGDGVRPLTDYELASRLSYFLWSSMPDEELLAHAAAGDLRQNEVLIAQTRRMLRDPRVRGLATEFAGNWLDFRRFEEHNGVDRDRFPAFTNELRQAMFEEPVRYFMDVAQRDRSVLDLLYGNDTFVNRPLAKHYGMPEPKDANEWDRVEDADRYGRGGLLPMAVFLTKNSPGLRTSPVKRGYWVVRRVLGEEIPPPPPTVPELPKDEAKLGELTLPQVLARHREDKSCAGCHNRFDSVGLVFEEFGPVGARRTKDLGGRPVTTLATFPDKDERSGMSGLRQYLRDKRQEDYVENLCRKMLSYGLSRGLLPSDRKTLRDMRKALEGNEYRFGSLVEAVVTSPQFAGKRAQPTTGAK